MNSYIRTVIVCGWMVSIHGIILAGEIKGTLMHGKIFFDDSPWKNVVSINCQGIQCGFGFILPEGCVVEIRNEQEEYNGEECDNRKFLKYGGVRSHHFFMEARKSINIPLDAFFSTFIHLCSCFGGC